MSEKNPKIVVLDGYTLNPGDLDWSALEELGDCIFHDRTKPEDVAAQIGDAEIALTNKAILSRDVIGACPNLKYIGVLATGYNVVDLAAARAADITVTNVPGYSTDSVAQLVFAHLLNFAHNVSAHADSVRAGEWANSRDFCYWLGSLTELSGLTMGLIGFGQIAKAVAKIAQAFGMKVIVYKPNVPKDPIDGVTFVSKAELFAESDVISLHCPLNEDTKFMINQSSLELMKPTAFLINTGRGDLIDEGELYHALLNGTIAGAGLDVASTEPIAKDHPLTKLENCSFTPHIGWATFEARTRLMSIVAGNVKSFLTGQPVNVVS